MKKKAVALACIAAMSLSAVPAFGADGVKVILNDEAVTFAGQQPVIVDGSTLIPVRGILEAMGVEVKWDSATKTVNMVQDEKSATLKLNEKTFVAGEEKKELTAPAQLIGGSTMIPLRAVAEYFGGTVAWDSKAKTVTVDTADSKTANFFTTAVYEDTLKAEDGTVLMTAKAEYPVLNANVSEKATELNATIAKEAKESVDAYVAANKEAVTKEAVEFGADFKAHDLLISFETPFCDGNIFSYRELFGIYTGGAHGDTIADGVTYDLKTGEVKAIRDLVSFDKNVADDVYIKSVIKTDIKNNASAYLEDASKTIGNAEVTASYYVNAKGDVVAFVAQRGSVKAYSEGIAEVVIKAAAIPAEEVKPAEKAEAYTTATYETDVKAADGTVVLTAKAEYPQLTAGEKAKEINATIEKDAKESIDAYVASRKADVVKEATDLGKDFKTNEVIISFDGAFSDEKVFSYKEIFYVFTGGAHGNQVADGVTFDLKTGIAKELSDFVKLEKDVTATDYIKNVIKADIEKNAAKYFEDAAKSLAETEVAMDFYLNAKGEVVVFVTQPYVVAPYASGIVEVVCNLA